MKKVLLALLLCAPGAARAGGLFAGDNGTQAAQRVGAFVAKADDPTALYHNPAGLAKVQRFQFYLGGNFVSFKQSFQREGNYFENDPAAMEPHGWAEAPYPEVSTSEFKAIPSLFASQGLLGNRLVLGEGVFAPMGMPNRHYGTAYPEVPGSTPGDDAPAPQRYDVKNQEGLVLFPSVGAAFRIHPMIDVGGRFSYGFAQIEGQSDVWAVGNAYEDPGSDGEFTFSVKDNFLYQWSLGLLARPAPQIEIGVMYQSKVEIRSKGTSSAVLGERVSMPAPNITTFVAPRDLSPDLCEPNKMGTPARLNTCIGFDLPMRLNAGVRYIVRDADGRERGDLELDVRWEQWSAASDVDVQVDGEDDLTGANLLKVKILHGFRDTYSFLLGGSWRFDLGKNGLIARAGAGYELGSAPNQWTRLDYDTLDRVVIGLGAGYEIGRFRIDAGLNYFLGLSRDVGESMLSATCMAAQPDTSCHPTASPSQPLEQQTEQDFHPFNAGSYESSYLIGSVGVTAWF